MGADLYIMPIYKKNKAKHEAKFHEAVQNRERFEASTTAKELGQKLLDDPRYLALQEVVDEHYDGMYSEGYFRDSYNATGVASSLGFSWWADVIPLLNKKGNLSGKNLRKFLEMASVKRKELTKESILKYGGTVDDGDNSVEAWNKSYDEAQKDLIAFVKLAIKKRLAIHCSL